uniref:Uncharacterized protein n=1 Tax=Plectus sambesii TaxID=2011161 RepID=A0A914XMP6_9BILA
MYMSVNACDYNDTAIQYCLAFCPNVTLKNQAIAVALSVRQPSRVAELIAAQQTGDDFVAVVLQVNPLAEPEARLIADVFLDPSWCSIYIYIQSTGFPYLFEMQMTRVKT